MPYGKGYKTTRPTKGIGGARPTLADARYGGGKTSHMSHKSHKMKKHNPGY